MIIVVILAIITVHLTGPQGVQGPAGEILSFADFYALMPPDNSATVAPGTDVSFPQDGPNSGADITRLGADSFNLGPIGTYHVLFQVSVTDAWSTAFNSKRCRFRIYRFWARNRNVADNRYGFSTNH